MLFIAFNLGDFKNQTRRDSTRVSFRMIYSKSFRTAREVVRTQFKGDWALIPKRVFDRGIVQARRMSP